MVARQSLKVVTEVVSFETGIWCDACLLPSAIRIHWTLTVLGRTSMQTSVVCESHPE